MPHSSAPRCLFFTLPWAAMLVAVTAAPLPAHGHQPDEPPVVAAVPTDPPARFTRSDLAQERARLIREGLSAAYLAEPKRQEQHDALYLDMIDKFARYSSSLPDAPSAQEVLASCDAIPSPPNFALRSMIRAQLLNDLEDEGARRPFSRTSGARHYPHFIKAVNKLAHLRFLTREKEDISESQLKDAASELAAVARDEKLTITEQRVLFDELREYFEYDIPGDEFFGRYFTSDKSKTWLAHMFRGEYHVKLAWQIRGGGYAVTVTPEGWQGFEEHLLKARGALEAAYAIAPQNPAAAAQLVRVAGAGHSRDGETGRLWFNRAIEAQFDYMPAYAAYQWFLWPRWGGSHEAMLNFALECAATGRFDTDVPYKFFEIVRDIGEDTVDFESCWRLPGVMRAAEKVTEGYIKEAGFPGFHRSRLASIAWRAGRLEQARELLDELGDNFDPSVMHTVAGDSWDMFSDVFAYTGAAAPAIPRGHRDETRRQQAALDAFLANAPELNEQEMWALKDKQYSAAWRTRVADSADWVPLELHPSLIGWRQARGRWHVTDDHAVVGEPLDAGPSLLLAGDLPARWEVKATIDPRTSDTRDSQNAGVIIGHRQTWKGPRWHSVQIDSLREHIASGAMWSLNGVTVPFTHEGPVALRVSVWDREIVVFVDDVEVCRATYPSEDFDVFRGRMGFGAYRRAQDTENLGPIEIRDIFIRTITEAP